MSLTKVSYSMINGAPANVLDFGAKGDGTTNDRPAFVLALATGKAISAPQPTSFYNIGTDLSITSPFVAGLYRVFGGAGVITFAAGAVSEAYPEWWAANTTPGTTDMAAAINAASFSVTGPTVTDAVSFTGVVKFQATKYRANTTLTYHGAPWKGSGYRSTMIEYWGTTVCLNAKGTSADRKIIDISNITFNGANVVAALTDGIWLAQNHRSQAGFYNVEFSFFTGWGVQEIEESYGLNCYGLLVKNNYQGGWNIANPLSTITTAHTFVGCLIENNGYAGSGKGGGFNSLGANSATYSFYGCTFQSNPGIAEIYYSGGTMLVDGSYFETDATTLNSIYLNGVNATISNNTFYGSAAHAGSAVLATTPFSHVIVTGNLGRAGLFTDGTARSINEATIQAGFNTLFTYTTDTTLGSVVSRTGRQAIGGWFQDNVAANQSNVILQRSSAAPTAFSDVFLPVRNGFVTGMVVVLNATITAGSLTVEVTKNGTAMGGALTSVITSGLGSIISLTDSLGVPFNTADNIRIRITTDAGFLPITVDMAVTLDITT